MVDKILIMRKLTELENYINQIQEYSNITVKEYSQDWKIQRIIERTLQMMIELCVDIANHVIADEKFRVPTNYSDTFKVLEEAQIISKRQYEKMKKMAQFRNIVVHQYDKIDETIVVNILRQNLKDFLQYRDSILKILK
ncbi:MAG: type II toxin-antitoxin system toxin [Candidatus Caldatribacteriota bacterium]